MNSASFFFKLRVIIPLICCTGLSIFSQNYPTDWTSKGVGGGGAVYSPTISPHNPDEMYLTCDMSMAHHSTDFGQHWDMIPPATLRTGRQASVQFTASPDTLYAMHRAAQTSVHSIVRSIDGGNSWQAVASNPFASTGVFQFFAHPQKTTTSVVADFSKIWMDTTAGTNFFQVYSTTDTKGAHLAGVFFDGDSVYVCSNKGVKYTFDNGKTWTTPTWTGIGSGEEIVSFRAAREGGTVRLIAVTLSSNDVHPRVYGNTGVLHFQNIYRLDFPAQNTWTNITAGLPSPVNDKLFNIAMVSGEIDTFFVGGSARVNGINLGSVFRTDNGGNSFQNVFLDAAALASNTDISPGWKGTATVGTTYMHKWNGISSTEGLCVDPNDLRRLARSDLSAVHVSEDYGQTWMQAYTLPQQPHPAGVLINAADTYASGGLETTVGYWMHFIGEDNFFAGYGDILMTHTLDGGNSWQLLYNGLFYQLLNDVNHITEHPNGTLYASTGEVPGTNGQYNDSRLAVTPGRLAYSTDQGQTWQTKTNFGHPVLWTALNPGNPDLFYAAVPDIPDRAGFIYRCDDIDNCNLLSDWTALPTPPRTEGRAQEIFVLADGTLVATYGPRDQGSFSFTASSGVFRMAPNGNAWTDLTPAAMQYDLRSLTIDPNDDNIWFACIGKNGPGTKGLYRSLNRGDDWTLVQSNMTVVSATFHPSLPNSMYFCTSNDGLFFATNTNAAFSATALTGYPFDFPQRVFFNSFDPNEVWVQNFGNGLRVGYTSLVLPVELSDFRAQATQEGVLLQWATASERNASHFVVERSSDGRYFTKIGKVEAMGNSTGFHRYAFLDKNPTASIPLEGGRGVIYYRLRQVDFDGKEELSKVVAIDMKDTRLRAYPNPVSGGELTLYFPENLNESMTVQLFDSTGRLARSTVMGSGTFSLDITGLAAGVYTLRAGAFFDLIVIQN
jgi:hypothetical protein